MIKLKENLLRTKSPRRIIKEPIVRCVVITVGLTTVNECAHALGRDIEFIDCLTKKFDLFNYIF